MMIRDIFEKILFMGSQAVPVIVIVFALRILLHRFPKKYLYFFIIEYIKLIINILQYKIICIPLTINRISIY